MRIRSGLFLHPGRSRWVGAAIATATAAAAVACGCSRSAGPDRAPERDSSRGSSSLAEPVALPPRAGDAVPVRVAAAMRVVIETPGVTGLSDLTVDDGGGLWAVAERKRVLVRIQAGGKAPRLVPLIGVPSGLDTEGLAWLGGSQLALATESDDPRRGSDLLLFARLVDGGARVAVDRSLALDYRLWPIRPRGNQGIEGLCSAGRALVASIETVLGDGEHRLAPVAVHDLDSGRWTPYFIRLTTSSGKLSALSCRPRGGVIDVMAIERHFEVAHLIRFRLPAPVRVSPARPRIAPVQLTPVLVANLAPLLENHENLEGLVWDGERTITLVADNDWVGVSGPNLLVLARLSGPAPAPLPPTAPLPGRPAPGPASPPVPRRR